MPLDLSDTLVVGISATALFDLAEADAVHKARYAKNPQSALQEYRAYMLERESEPLRDGTGMALVRALLGLNTTPNPTRSRSSMSSSCRATARRRACASSTTSVRAACRSRAMRSPAASP